MSKKATLNRKEEPDGKWNGEHYDDPKTAGQRMYNVGYSKGWGSGHEEGLKVGRTMGPQSITLKDFYSTLRMVREELVFGGDWETAKKKIDECLNKK
jgi:hypothetical protein